MEIKGDDKYKKKEIDSDTLWVMKKIKQMPAGINTKKNEFQAYVNKCWEVWNCVQALNESLDAFQKRFRSTVQTADLAGGHMIFILKLKHIGAINMDQLNNILHKDVEV